MRVAPLLKDGGRRRRRRRLRVAVGRVADEVVEVGGRDVRRQTATDGRRRHGHGERDRLLAGREDNERAELVAALTTLHTHSHGPGRARGPG